MLCGCQFVFLNNISDGKARDVGWVGGVGKDDSTDNLGRGGVDFFQLVNFVDGDPPLQQLFGFDDIDKVIERKEGIFVF